MSCHRISRMNLISFKRSPSLSDHFFSLSQMCPLNACLVFKFVQILNLKSTYTFYILSDMTIINTSHVKYVERNKKQMQYWSKLCNKKIFLVPTCSVVCEKKVEMTIYERQTKRDENISHEPLVDYKRHYFTTFKYALVVVLMRVLSRHLISDTLIWWTASLSGW